jgi:hypothetical protein
MKKIICSLLLLVLSGCGSSPSSGFVPEDFEVPGGFETPDFRVRPITAADAEKDYEAVMESREIIHSALLNDSWPTESFTLEENRRDLAIKEIRFEQRTSFTYTVVSLDETQVLGCVYINEGQQGPDAAVFMWVRASAQDMGLDSLLENSVREWIDRDWEFSWVVYPGRSS